MVKFNGPDIPFRLWFGTYRSLIIMIQEEAKNKGIAIAKPRLSNEVIGHYGRLNIPKLWCDGYIYNKQEIWQFLVDRSERESFDYHYRSRTNPYQQKIKSTKHQ